MKYGKNTSKWKHTELRTWLLPFNQEFFSHRFANWDTEIKGTVKGKVRPTTGHEGPEGEERYSASLSLTSALDEGEWITPHPGRFIPSKETR